MKKDSKSISKKPMTKSKISPLHDRVLIKLSIENVETTTKSGIIIPAGVADDKGGKRGEVVAVGAGKYENGKLIPVSVKPGDTVIFQWGDKVREDNKDYYIVRESEILAVIK